MLFDTGEPRKTKQQEKREARAQKIAGRNAALADAGKALAGHQGLLSRFAAEMAQLFRSMEGEQVTHGRRPNISLRLIATGEPAAKLIVLPDWNPIRKVMDLDWFICELLTENIVANSEGPDTGREWRQALSFGFGQDPPRVGSIRLEGWGEDIGRAVETIRDFIEDRRSVLARARDHCAICGRPLTDELSRGRGIGPECIQKLPWNIFIGEASLIETDSANA